MVLKNLQFTINVSALYQMKHKGADSLSKQVEYAHTLDHEAHEGPPHKNQDNPSPECCAAPPFLFSREEQEGALRAEKKSNTDEEKDVAHGEESAVKEQDETEKQEEDT